MKCQLMGVLRSGYYHYRKRLSSKKNDLNRPKLFDLARKLQRKSDRGFQYASKDYTGFLNAWFCIGSMSRKGNCWGNAAAESFFGSLKQERVMWPYYQTRWQAQQEMLQYITLFYNHSELNSSLSYKSPNQVERK